MGMYTELVFKAEVKTELPMEVESVLQCLFNGDDEPEFVPEHDFFKCQRWSMIGRCSSYYHTPFAISKYEGSYIFSRSDLKNYDGEIDLFIDWIRPYLSEFPEKCIGWKWYEEEDAPTLIFAGVEK